MITDYPLNIIFAFINTALVTIFLLPRLSSIALKIELIDYPDKRKVHVQPKPLVGGLGMIMAFSITCLLFVPLSSLRGFIAGIIMLVIIGFLDDYSEMNHRLKFLVQVAASIIMIIFSNNILYSFGNIFGFGPVQLGSFAILLTIFCTVGVINSINMIDGLDGLAGGVSLISLLSFSFLAYINGQIELVLICVGLSGAVIGFLKYNWNPAKLFMGDAGSLAIGFALAFLAISITQKESSTVPPIAALLIMAVPVVDTVTLMIKRVIRGKSPFSPDTKHFHHILISYGFSRKNSVKIILFISVLFSATAIWGTVYKIPEYYLFMIFSLYFISYFVASFHIERVFSFIFELMNKEPGTQYGGILSNMESADNEETEHAKAALMKRSP